MDIINEKALLIAAEMENQDITKPGFVISITMIATIVGIISDVVRIYQECKKTPSEAADSMRSGNLLERLRLRKIIHQHINQNISDKSIHDNINQKLFNSALKVSSKLQDDEVQKMYDEVQ